MKKLIVALSLLLFAGGRHSPLWTLLTSMALPASEDTRSKQHYYVHEDSCDHITFASPSDLDAGDLLLVGLAAGGSALERHLVGVIDDHVHTGELASAFVKEGILVRTSMRATGIHFTTFGQEVWFDPITMTITDAQDSDLYLIGYVREVEDLDGVVGFEKRRYALVGSST